MGWEESEVGFVAFSVPPYVPLLLAALFTQLTPRFCWLLPPLRFINLSTITQFEGTSLLVRTLTGTGRCHRDLCLFRTERRWEVVVSLTGSWEVGGG